MLSTRIVTFLFASTRNVLPSYGVSHSGSLSSGTSVHFDGFVFCGVIRRTSSPSPTPVPCTFISLSTPITSMFESPALLVNCVSW